MNIELQNEKQTETLLNKYPDELEIALEFIDIITNSSVGKDITHLIALQNQATLRIRSFLASQFNQLGVQKQIALLDQRQMQMNTTSGGISKLHRQNSYSNSSLSIML
eukprot:500706_1